MPEYRKDPLTGRWVIVAENRADRPNQFDIDAHKDSISDFMLCPFCPTNLDQTPRELDRIENTTNSEVGGVRETWAARTVPNKYAAVGKTDVFPDYKTFQTEYGPMLDVDFPLSQYEDTFFDPIPGFGTHELIIDTPRHILCVSEMTEDEVYDMFRMYRKRLLALKQEKKCAHALIFKNVGYAAGASIYHTHSQLIALPFLPPPIQRELQRAIGFRREMDDCFWCTHLKHEIANTSRIIETTERFVSLCPYVSRFPAEIAIYPKEHCSHFEEMDDDMLWEYAQLLRRTIQLLIKGADWLEGRISYNMILKSGPFVYSGPLNMTDISDSAFWIKKLDYSYEKVYHVHISILPSLAKAAGFEWGCGMHINPVAPETAAAKLRDLIETLKASEELNS